MREVYGRSLEGYKFADLHFHTRGSRDVRRKNSGLNPHEAVLFAQNSGLDALAITDHDAIDTAYEALEFGIMEGIGVEVIVGQEITSKDGHMIGLYLKEEVPPLLSAGETVRNIHKQGGLAIIPHPFHEHLIGKSEKSERSLGLSAISQILDSTEEGVYIDGIEIHNMGVVGTVRVTSESKWFRYRDSNIHAQKLYEGKGDGLGAAIGVSDGHGLSVGRGLTAFQGDLRSAIENRTTMAAVLGPEDETKVLDLVVSMFGKERIFAARLLKSERAMLEEIFGK